MQQRTVKGAIYGPWLVGLGAALWGTESAWRIPLNELFDAKVIVFWEHVFILILFLPILISRMNEIPKVSARTWGYLIFSGFAGSAVGTIFFTLALKYGEKASDAQTGLEILSSKVGLVLVVLGIMHFFNLFVFSKMRRRAHKPAIPPLLHSKPV